MTSPSSAPSLPAGLWPVMLTPFNDDGTINWPGVDALTDWYIDQGAAGLFACCLSSEILHLYHEERFALVRRVVSRAAGRVPVIATGNFGGSFEHQLACVQRMGETGVRTVVLLPNMLAPPDEPETALQAVVERLLGAYDGVPLGFYECPKPTHRVLSPDFLRWAAGTGRFLFHKDTCGSLPAITAKLAALRGSPLAFTNAHTPSLLASFTFGGAGCCPIAANYFPHLYARLWRDRTNPNIAPRLQETLSTLEPEATRKYPVSAKAYLGKLGLPIGRRCRMIDFPWAAEDERLIERIQNQVSLLDT